jgi:hypothetical protein
MGQILGNAYSLLVKLHDRGDNMRTIRYLPPRDQPEYLLETRKLSRAAYGGIRLYRALGDALHKARNLMSASSNMYLDDCEYFASLLFAKGIDLASLGKPGEIFNVLRNAGMIGGPNAPRPSSAHGQLLRPTGP